MTAEAGRDIDFTWNALPVLGVREKGISANGEPIDVTSDEDNGWRTLLAVPGQNEIEVSLSGVTKDTRLKADWFAGTRTRAVTFTYPNGDVVSGSFFMANFNEGIAYNDAYTFEATLQSTGVVTYTPYS